LPSNIGYYVDASGNYLGAWDDGNANIPVGSTKLTTPPSSPTDIWNGSAWVAGTLTEEEKQNVPISGIDFYDTGWLPVVSGGGLTVEHGLEGLPTNINPMLKCISPEDGYDIGDIMYFYPQANSGGDGMSLVCDEDYFSVRLGSSGSTFDIINKNTGQTGSLNPTKWKIRFFLKR